MLKWKGNNRCIPDILFLRIFLLLLWDFQVLVDRSSPTFIHRQFTQVAFRELFSSTTSSLSSSSGELLCKNSTLKPHSGQIPGYNIMINMGERMKGCVLLIQPADASWRTAVSVQWFVGVSQTFSGVQRGTQTVTLYKPQTSCSRFRKRLAVVALPRLLLWRESKFTHVEH